MDKSFNEEKETLGSNSPRDPYLWKYNIDSYWVLVGGVQVGRVLVIKEPASATRMR
jgi:hypothetical protein